MQNRTSRGGVVFRICAGIMLTLLLGSGSVTALAQQAGSGSDCSAPGSGASSSANGSNTQVLTSGGVVTLQSGGANSGIGSTGVPCPGGNDLPALPNSTGWQPGPTATGANTYQGIIELPSSAVQPGTAFTVSGWIADTTAQGWAGIDQVALYSGQMGQGGTQIATGQAGAPRPDIAAALGNNSWTASGFSINVPSTAPNLSANASGTLQVYVHTPNKGWWYKPVTINVAPAAAPQYPNDPLLVIETPNDGQYIVTGQNYVISGYALDRNAGPGQGTGVDRVEVYIYGEKGTQNGIDLGDAQLGQADANAGNFYTGQFGNAGWQITLTTSNYHAGGTPLYVYAHSSVTGKTTLKTITLNIQEAQSP